jgi:teichuronic acid biosynthesis glycosyltransferase TuaG
LQHLSKNPNKTSLFKTIPKPKEAVFRKKECLMGVVSVIIPSYHGEAYIAEALESVAAQTYPHWEIIVVEDASHDRTEDIVNAFRQEFPNHRVGFIRHAHNQGVSATRNTAIHAARGQWLAFLDHDDVWMPRHLEAGLGALAAGDGDLCFSEVEGLEGTVRTFGDRLPALEISAGWRDRLFLKNAIVLSTVILRRNALGPEFPFDPNPKVQHCEDYDLWLRLAEQGRQFVRTSEVSVRYRTHGAQATARRGMMLEREWQVMLKHHGSYPSSKTLKRRRMSELARTAGMHYWTEDPSKAACYLKQSVLYGNWSAQAAWLALKATLRAMGTLKNPKAAQAA